MLEIEGWRDPETVVMEVGRLVSVPESGVVAHKIVTVNAYMYVCTCIAEISKH